MTISIITTTYNSKDTIELTIESVLSQTYQDIDYWIIDGGSTDGTLEIIKKYQQQYANRVNYISEPDQGMYDAMNKGITKCSGDVVGMLNSDDFFTTNDVVAKIAEAFADDIDAVYGDIHFVKKENQNKCTRYYSSRIWQPYMLRFGFMPAHPTFYVRRSIYMAHGLYSLDYRIASDYDMMVRLFYVNKIKAKYLPYDFVTMRQGGLSTQNAKSRMILNKEDIKACRKYGMKTNYAFIMCKYFKKIFEFRL